MHLGDLVSTHLPTLLTAKGMNKPVWVLLFCLAPHSPIPRAAFPLQRHAEAASDVITQVHHRQAHCTLDAAGIRAASSRLS